MKKLLLTSAAAAAFTVNAHAYDLGVDLTFPQPSFDAPSTSLELPTVPTPVPQVPQPWLRPIPLPDTPGLIGGGQTDSLKYEGYIFNTPAGPSVGGQITYPANPETIIKEEHNGVPKP